jgi:hypothetical protein
MQRTAPKHHVQRDLLAMEHAVELQLRPGGIKLGQRQAVLPKAIEDGILDAQSGEARVTKLIVNAVEAKA